MARSLANLMGLGMGAQSAKLINGIVADGLASTGTTQADALPLPGDVNVVALVVANSGVLLPAVPQPSDEIEITNFGANALLVYPSPGGSVQGGAVNTPFSLPVGATATFIARAGSANWIVLASSGAVAPPPGTAGQLLFNQTAQSGLLVLLEDI
jgi:hypothetical protein